MGLVDEELEGVAGGRGVSTFACKSACVCW